MSLRMLGFLVLAIFVADDFALGVKQEVMWQRTGRALSAGSCLIQWQMGAVVIP